MKYKSVEELKDSIMKEIEECDTFEAYLFSKYPSLFLRDDEGNLLPQSQRCWNDCPKGWESIVESLFGCIDDYVKNSKRSVVNPQYKLRFKFRSLYWKYFKYPTHKPSNPFKLYLKKFIDLISKKFFLTKNLYITVSPLPAIIEQYKEKFGILRIYYNGGDKVIDGMIRYAEYLSSITCQDTGKSGKMYRRGNWYATLCDEQAEKHGYKLANN